MSKTCTQCKVDKSLEDFHKHVRSKTGYRSTCKLCRVAKSKTYYDVNFLKISQYTAEHRKKNKERINRVKRDKYALDPTYYLTLNKRWSDKNQEHLKKYHRNYIQNNKEKHQFNNAARRIRLRNVEISDFTQEEWFLLLKDADGKCPLCNTEQKLTMDHVVPISKGGDHTLTNIIAICKSCNCKKGTKTLLEYVQSKFN